ncbi:MAG: hypothetical protein EOO68_06020 [Moraxellaceae bacterium]|nr:MAG: hypothetical protein EOO68_06020 [Moraxellaceae bacterium]
MRLRLFWFYLLVVTTLSSCDKSNHWAAMARADIDYIKQIVEQNHPGYVDPNNPQFKTQLEQNYKNVIDQLQYVQSLDAVLNLDNEFIASFADYHVSIEFRFKPAFPMWAGMKIERRNEKYVVTKLADAWPVGLPNIDSELIGCDGRSAKEIMDYDILRYRYANYDVEYPRIKYASKLLLDDGIGFRKRLETCVFQDATKTEISYALKWQAFTNQNSAEWDAAVAKKDNFSIERLPESVVWVRLPSFQPEGAEIEKMSTGLKLLADMHADANNTIVFDVRGNSGGYLGSAAAFVQSVYGIHAFVSLFSAEIKDNTRLLRASPAHVERIKKMVDRNAMDDMQRNNNQALISAFESSITQGLPFAKNLEQRIDFSIADSRPIEDIRKSLPKLVVVTDHFCASECLTFVQLIVHEPNNLHIGATTYSDSTYSLLYPKDPFELPSKLGSFNLPFAIFGQNGPFVPSLKFGGDMNDTDELKRWLMNIVKH